ncbi:MAG TPA: radical SAM protein [Vicinamibacterales bacterium]|nr:radical SAM protein [Vicinamibacterales bacterium]
MLGASTLFVNPPLVGGIAFTRQGRCQEREEVLGTTKPPYTLALAAALFREKGWNVRLDDLTATGRSVDDLIAKLDAEGFRATLIVFPSTTPTLEADAAEMARLKAHFRAPVFGFGAFASCTPHEAMARAQAMDGFLVGEPEDGLLALGALESLDGLDEIPSLTFRRQGQIVPHRAHGTFAGFLNAPYPAWDLLDLTAYRLPVVNKSYVLVETSRGCPYSCDFCVAPIHQGHKFREKSAKVLVDEIERGYRELGLSFFYLWGDTVTLNVKSFSAFCEELIARNLPVEWFGNARADNLTDPEFVKRLRKAGCWMLALGIETESEETRKDMMKRLDGQKIRAAIANMRSAGIRSFAFFIFGYPGETPASLERTTRYAIDLDPDFANFYPAVPYPGTELHAKAKREGLLVSEDWTRMEYSYYLLRGNGLDEPTVMGAINRAKRRFYLRPGYLMKHSGDVVRLATTKWDVVWHVASRALFGAPVSDAAPDDDVRRASAHLTVGTADPVRSTELAGGQPRSLDRP